MRTNAILVLAAVFIATPRVARTQPETVPIETTGGVYRTSLMPWYAPYLFPGGSVTDDGSIYHWRSVPDLVLLGVVVGVEPPAVSPDDSTLSCNGRLKIERVVRCPEASRRAAEKIRFVDSDGFEGLRLGDRILLFMIPYETVYAIPSWYCPNSRIGVRFPRPDEPTPLEEGRFVQLVAAKLSAPVDSLTVEELRLWARADPCGIAEALIEQRETTEPVPRER